MRSEIIDWYLEERARVVRECEQAKQRYLAKACDSIDALSLRDLFFPKSETKTAIKEQLRSDVNIFQRRLARSIDENLLESIRHVESDDTNEDNTSSWALMGAGSALAAASIGTAIGATAMATTTSSAFLFFAAPIVSWPMFAVGASAAGALAFASRSVREKAADMYRNSLKSRAETYLSETLIEGKTGSASIRNNAMQHLDFVREQRFKGVNA
ncbi:hypothetical protein [Aestuariicoccus sp. MJ-SS9]|uniref:hypothetical protein n=1 Tax=Aestuariicoccus sp. MJ-SS9 TaxID=3079855 RepID=UPI0029079674|nr:hypothetical protein [Aestuariicoccus sp. MJ-SS9]MDU8912491.1 hypothetical protein [Aestuariicoccus sp. MJ-SS9]